MDAEEENPMEKKAQTQMGGWPPIKARKNEANLLSASVNSSSQFKDGPDTKQWT